MINETETINKARKLLKKSADNQHRLKYYYGPEFFLNKYINEIKSMIIREYVLFIYEEARKISLKHFNNDLNESGLTPSCKKGCSFCCSFPISVLPFESLLIEQYVKDNFSNVQKKELKRNLKNTKNRVIKEVGKIQITKSYKEKYYQKDIKCPFLNESNLCSIYDVRPLSCISYLEFINSSKCQNGNISDSAAAFLDVESAIRTIVRSGIIAYCEYHKLDSKTYLDRYTGASQNDYELLPFSVDVH
ncbi:MULTISPECIES: YkgJ family cysteine cluster protein [Aeribacillus]|jgi:Fe-S-cluster containining protein|uniref:Zinc/iron-chelating domain-containing protein n=1 Tax=Aeribacillus pallidus TaxID=33936 RepID=A0A165YVB8_9BACI|nr:MULTISPECIES: YkgJ family cysteine cluster protein [Aeribacillus]KZN97488.1 hypothetical protein AZI98_03535 [Aeribacillus pallidus]MED0717551.1 YkgJ family cysteine cluster protein [Aeribacillus composti]MED0747576.1 YkgJ family cysteine cluster protein [Aeribacillus composti]